MLVPRAFGAQNDSCIVSRGTNSRGTMIRNSYLLIFGISNDAKWQEKLNGAKPGQANLSNTINLV